LETSVERYSAATEEIRGLYNRINGWPSRTMVPVVTFSTVSMKASVRSEITATRRSSS
jgi:hypothetical protein